MPVGQARMNGLSSRAAKLSDGAQRGACSPRRGRFGSGVGASGGGLQLRDDPESRSVSEPFQPEFEQVTWRVRMAWTRLVMRVVEHAAFRSRRLPINRASIARSC